MPYSTGQAGESNAELLGSLQGGNTPPPASRTPVWDPAAITVREGTYLALEHRHDSSRPDQALVTRAAASRWIRLGGTYLALERRYGPLAFTNCHLGAPPFGRRCSCCCC